MKPINCCKGCKWLNENGTFRNKLRCMFCDAYFQEETGRLYDEQKSRKGCSTCINCKHVYDYPGFVTAEENVCVAGLECDTVTFEVKDCPEWKGKYESEVEVNE